MTESQKKLVEKMCFLGYGYRNIANRLGLKRDTVRNYCKSKGLDGRADEFVEAPKPDISVCVCCGVPLVNAPKGRNIVLPSARKCGKLCIQGKIIRTNV